MQWESRAQGAGRPVGGTCGVGYDGLGACPTWRLWGAPEGLTRAGNDEVPWQACGSWTCPGERRGSGSVPVEVVGLLSLVARPSIDVLGLGVHCVGLWLRPQTGFVQISLFIFQQIHGVSNVA